MNQNQHTNAAFVLKRTFRISWRFFFLAAAIFFLCSSCTSINIPNQPEARIVPSETKDSAEKAVALQTEAQALELLPKDLAWKQAAPGVLRLDCTLRKLPSAYHVIRIDMGQLSAEGYKISLTASPYAPSTDEAQPGCYKPVRTRSFAAQSGCTVAVNTAPFSKEKKGLVRPIGIHRVNGASCAVPVSRYSALAFSGSKDADGRYESLRATVIRSQDIQECEKYDYVFGGFYTILWEGEEQEFKVESSDSRTAAGVDSTGTVLYLLVAEGEVPEKSTGLSFQQCAKILKALGCEQALEFDGGGASELCVNGKSVLPYTPPRAQCCSLGMTVLPQD